MVATTLSLLYMMSRFGGGDSTVTAVDNNYKFYLTLVTVTETAQPLLPYVVTQVLVVTVTSRLLLQCGDARQF